VRTGVRFWRGGGGRRIRRANAVGRPDRRRSFARQAVEFVQRVERIVLIDGARLTGLMIEHAVGVGHRVVKVPKVDGDYFVE